MDNDFPVEFDEIVDKIASQYKVKLKKDTHCEAVNRVFEWYGVRRLYRLDLNLNLSSVEVVLYIDEFKYPIWIFRILEFCHNYLPNFPYYANVKIKKFGTILLNLTKDEYANTIETYIKMAKEL